MMTKSEDSLLDEHFVPISDYETYEVSNYGRVFNALRSTELRQTMNGAGYLRVALYKNGQRREFQVHRLVAQAFFADFKPELSVEFLNDNHFDCTVRNLTLNKPNRVTKRIKVVETGQIFDSLSACAEAVGGTAKLISRAARGNADTKTHRGYHYEYVN